MGYVDTITKKQGKRGRPRVERAPTVMEKVKAVFTTPDPEPVVPEIPDGVICVMLTPKNRRNAFILAGRVYLYHEIVRVDKEGYAYPKTVAGVTALKVRGFSVAREAAHAISL